MVRAPREATSRRSYHTYHHHQRRNQDPTASNGNLLNRESPSPELTPKKTGDARNGGRRPAPSHSGQTSSRGGFSLSASALSQLDAMNERLGWNEYDGLRSDRERLRNLERERVRKEDQPDDEVWVMEEGSSYHETSTQKEEREYREMKERQQRRDRKQRRRHEEDDGRRRRRKRVSDGPVLEEGKRESYGYRLRHRTGALSEMGRDTARRRRRKRLCVLLVIFILLLALIIPVAIVVGGRSDSSDSANNEAIPGTTDGPANTELNSISESDIPASVKGTYFDPFTWYDTTDFNVAYTEETVGGLPVMGLHANWDDNTRAHSSVPPLDERWAYGEMPIRGMNLGGWLNLEPFITPSFFESYSTRDGVLDEYTLCQKLGPAKAASILEQHYSSWVTERTFADIQAAGFDHVRIPFGYWAVTTYKDDPYVKQTSWRYLLRGIEWARKYGLRVKLDLHGAPGSQNGWNHSGRQGNIGWLNGTDGALNGQRTIEIHEQLSTFFAQPRYRNVVTMYGLVNEPKMVSLDTETVTAWSRQAISTIRGNNITSIIVFGDGFLGLDNWQGRLQGVDTIQNALLLDVHQYVIFNVDQLALTHTEKINFACGGWTQQMMRSQDRATGFGPTICGEWSQADTDCAKYLNNVGQGSRWEGTLNFGFTPGANNVFDPTCPTQGTPQCSCTAANADPSEYSDSYKKFLRMFAEAQLHSFEKGWGSFYWTWDTEKSVQWSWKKGLEAGILPSNVRERGFNCDTEVPDFAAIGLPETY